MNKHFIKDTLGDDSICDYKEYMKTYNRYIKKDWDHGNA